MPVKEYEPVTESHRMPGDHLLADPESGLVKPLTLWSPSKFLAYEVDPSSILLEGGIVEKGEWTSLLGIGGLGKSRLALALCIAQLTGQKWCGLTTGGAPATTLFLSTENGIRRWKTDLDCMFKKLTEAQREVVENNLRCLAITPEEDADLNLGNSDARKRLQVTLEQSQPGFVVLDPFADMVDGDENKAQDVGDTLRTLRQIFHSAAPRAAVLIIHHARTGASNVAQAGDNYSAGNFGRGSKTLYSRVRAEIQLSPGDRDDPNRLVLACGKSNNAPKFATRGIIFDPETFSYSVDPAFDVEDWRNDVSGKRTNKSVSIEDVVLAVKEACPHPGDSVKSGQLVQSVIDVRGGSRKTVFNRLSEAVEAGYLRKAKGFGYYALGSKPLKASN